MNDIRVGTILTAEPFLQARKPAYRLTVDFGAELGIKASSAQVTAHYTQADLIGTQVIAAVDLGAKRIAGFVSEVLVLGLPDADGNVVLVRPDRRVADGAQLY